MNELAEIAYRQELAKAQHSLHAQTLLIVAGGLIAAFFAGYVYHDLQGDNHA